MLTWYLRLAVLISFMALKIFLRETGGSVLPHAGLPLKTNTQTV